MVEIKKSFPTNDWSDFFKQETEKQYFKDILQYYEAECSSYTVFPPIDKVFAAFNYSSFKLTRVVIIGQDPYHGKGQANGLCFSVEDQIKIPPSLRNIFKELNSDMGCSIPKNGNLVKWARQGVLLLNSVLTVRAAIANSHKNIGWEQFTDQVIRHLSDNKDFLVFILWGNDAHRKKEIIDNDKHVVLAASHPSPFSAYRGFFDSKPFSKTNVSLKKRNLKAINWCLD